MMLGRNSTGYIWHQGTIYEATSYAVAVFLELLRQPATPGKHDVLAFLALLFNISSCRRGSKGRKTLGLRQKYRGGASLPRLLFNFNQTTQPASFSSSVLSCLAARRPLCAWQRPTDVRTD